MSQINIREGEIKEMKEEHHSLKHEMAQNMEDKNTILNEKN